MIQLYISKKNFDAQKAERFFKERRVQVQVMDLKKHKLGERELQTMAKDVGMQGLLDREDKRAKEHPACYCNIDSVIMTAIQENPWLLKSPHRPQRTKMHHRLPARNLGKLAEGGQIIA